MKRQRTGNSFLEDDEMGSYGVHPLVHEQLVRCHNRGLFGTPKESVALPQKHQRVRELMSQRALADVRLRETGITLSA